MIVLKEKLNMDVLHLHHLNIKHLYQSNSCHHCPLLTPTPTQSFQIITNSNSQQHSNHKVPFYHLLVNVRCILLLEPNLLVDIFVRIHMAVLLLLHKDDHYLIQWLIKIVMKLLVRIRMDSLMMSSWMMLIIKKFLTLQKLKLWINTIMLNQIACHQLSIARHYS